MGRNPDATPAEKDAVNFGHLAISKIPSLAEGDELITGREVSRITGMPPRRVREAARAGLLTTYEPPAGIGGVIRYSRASAEALARSTIRPATVTAPTEGVPDA